MSTITYTAKDRGLIYGGRVAGTTYVFDAPFKSYDEDMKRKTSGATSLSGVSETILHRVEYSASIETIPLNDTAINDQMVEFLRSVAGGESFLIDIDGTAALPDSPVSATLEGDPSRQRAGRSETFIYTFKVKL